MRNFQADLNKGLMGQQLFAKLVPCVRMTDGKRGDFLLPDGSKVEVKADFYNMNKSDNFFIERYSSLEAGTPGGPWQCAAHECQYFAYLYVQNLHVYIFETGDLLKQLESLESTLKPVNVRNRSWTTVGYKVSRGLLMPAVELKKGANNEIIATGDDTVLKIFGLGKGV